MLEIKGARIRLTRGDTAALAVDIVSEKEDGTCEPYTMADTDTLTMSAKRNTVCKTVSLTLQAVGSPVLLFRPEDTKELPPGEYDYDTALKTAGGDVYTVVGQGIPSVDAVLVILPEVTV